MDGNGYHVQTHNSTARDTAKKELGLCWMVIIAMRFRLRYWYA